MFIDICEPTSFTSLLRKYRLIYLKMHHYFMITTSMHAVSVPYSGSYLARGRFSTCFHLDAILFKRCFLPSRRTFEHRTRLFFYHRQLLPEISASSLSCLDFNRIIQMKLERVGKHWERELFLSMYVCLHAHYYPITMNNQVTVTV